MKVENLWIFLLVLSTSDCYIRDPGSRVIPTKGEIWPQPQIQNKSDEYLVVRPQFFNFQVVVDKECSILKEAAKRYKKLILEQYKSIEENLEVSSHEFHKKSWNQDKNFLNYLDSANVVLNGPCDQSEYPKYGAIESYEINITNDSANVSSTTIWGVLRALESFSQLIYLGDDKISLRVNLTSISDFPRFSHRGILIDTSRHYIPIDELLNNLDAMAYNKMNVFHWHIVDDESFPYVSKKYPELSKKGAYKPNLVYTQADIKRIIEYARVRGIRVIPEFDTPAHTRSYGVAFKELLSECHDDDGKKTGQLGPLNPTKQFTFEFLKELFKEVSEVFPDEYIHLGGDELGYECWNNSQEINTFMELNNMTNFTQLEDYYVKKLTDIVKDQKSKIIVWQELFQNNDSIPLDSIVQVWLFPFNETINEVISSGRKALLSSCWYLDHLQSGGDWGNFYFCEPCANITNCESVIGGEACMWSEVVNQYNFISRIWPRASAVAERLWSAETVTNATQASMRLEEHACRLNKRKIYAQPPNGPSICY